MEKKIDTADLKLGMYIVQLDRPWLETPFLFQGFYVKAQQDIADLRKFCRFVVIDESKGTKCERNWQPETQTSPSIAKDNPFPVRKVAYEVTSDFRTELVAAKEHQRQFQTHVTDLLDEIHAGGKIDIASIKPTISEMIDSVLRNPDAFMWLSRMHKADGYLYSHALDSSVLATTFGRHLGLDKRELEDLAIGALLFDVGKMKLPSELLSKPDKLSESEFALVRRHVEFSVELMSETKTISKQSINIASTHHERHNGQGYPNRLIGPRIPVFGRIAAIVDCYDAIISQRPYAQPLSSHDAILRLYEWRNIDFQEDLVEQFIQCLGVYPTGSIVELNDGTVGIVIAQNPIRRLKPKVMVILDNDKKPMSTFRTVDLFMEQARDENETLEITRALETGAYGIDPKQFFL